MNKGLVYLSPYGHKKDFIKILELIKNIKGIDFNIYTSIIFEEYKKYKHLLFKSFSNEFKNDFYDAGFLISSSGHQLLSEAINGELPSFVFSLNTFSQNFNCKMISDNKLGKKIENYSISEFYEKK